ncbi:hypothetical protein HYH03_010050 [Edaphochlamys debaryana]|uniref:MYND-type domain-containing protein n=1 Tax=Edaphochlamys debaryana TaxID=47281 RepID=A0A836BX57_9CHLO|nr:hypothetical protein HYH03_010050 [Edaphochlamys debaryana]|eukprot:KAG2491682.1 hypothetical protein HYH03_010050 [Edaphochlamys debaryana]
MREELVQQIGVLTANIAVRMLVPAAGDPARTFAEKLLAMGTLQAAARQTAAAAQVLAVTLPAAGAGPGPSEPAAGSGLASEEQRLRIAGRLVDAMALVQTIITFVTCTQLVSSLVAALSESRFLEHAGRLMLLLPLPPGQPPSDGVRRRPSESDGLRKALACVCNAMCYTVKTVCIVDSGHAAFGVQGAEGFLTSVLGPCVRMAVLESGALALSMTDGGHAYGAAYGLLYDLPTPPGIATAAPHQQRKQLDGHMVAAVLHALATDARCSKDRALPRAGAAPVLLRVGRLALASASAALGGVDSEGSAGSDGGFRVRLRLGAEEVCHTYLALMDDNVTDECVLKAVDMLPDLITLGPWAPAASQRRRAEALGAWQLALGAAYHALPILTDAGAARCLGGYLSKQDALLRHVAGGRRQPAAATHATRWGAALPCGGAGGWAGAGPGAHPGIRSPGQRDARSRGSRATGGGLGRLPAALAHAQPRQAAALLASLAKLLRLQRARPQTEPEGAAAGHVGLGLAARRAVEALLGRALEHAVWEPGSLRAPSLLVPLRLLPSAAECARRALELAGTDPSDRAGPGAAKGLALACPTVVLRWVWELAARADPRAISCSGGGGAVVESTGGPPGAAASGAEGASSALAEAEVAASAAQWRSFLLGEVGAVTLLGAALGGVQRWAEWPPPGTPRDPGAAASSADPAEASSEGDGPDWPDWLQALAGACSSVMYAWLAEVRQGGSAAAPLQECGSAASAAPAPTPWPPGALRLLASQLDACGGGGSGWADNLMAVASFLEPSRPAAAAEGGAGGASGSGAAESGGRRGPEFTTVPWPVLALLAEARALLPVCASPACVNLAGDSEAGLRLVPCSCCGGVSYCSLGCQRAHWQIGHGIRAAAAEAMERRVDEIPMVHPASWGMTMAGQE